MAEKIERAHGKKNRREGKGGQGQKSNSRRKMPRMEQRSRKEVEHIHTKDEKTGTKETRPNATRDSDTDVS